MNDKQAALLGAAFRLVKSAERDMDLLLSGMTAGMEGQLVNADTDNKVFNLEVPDIQEEKKV